MTGTSLIPMEGGETTSLLWSDVWTLFNNNKHSKLLTRIPKHYISCVNYMLSHNSWNAVGILSFFFWIRYLKIRFHNKLTPINLIFDPDLRKFIPYNFRSLSLYLKVNSNTNITRSLSHSCLYLIKWSIRNMV